MRSKTEATDILISMPLFGAHVGGMQVGEINKRILGVQNPKLDQNQTPEIGTNKEMTATQWEIRRSVAIQSADSKATKLQRHLTTIFKGQNR